MLDRSVLKNIGIASLILSLGLTAPAYASVKQVGFQWVSPYDGSGNAQLSNVQIPPAPSAAPVRQVMPQNLQNPEVISPVIIDGTRMAPTPYNGTYNTGATSGSYNSVSPVVNTPSGQMPNTLPSAPSPTQQVVVSSSSAPTSGTSNDMTNSVPVIGGSPMIAGTPITNGAMSMGAPVIDATPNYNGNVISTSSAMAPPAPMPMAAPAPMGNDVVQGFANQVPLAVALRQLLPPGYGFSVDQNVDLGTLVSFRGGRPWRETLRTAIDPSGLNMYEQGQMITITKAGGPALTSSSSVANNVMTNNTMAPLPPPQPMQQLPMDNNPSHLLQPPMNVDPVVMPPSVIAANNTPVMQSWNADRGDTLHKILESWSRRANVEFEWLAEYDYPMQASYSFNGTFEEAVRSLLTGFEGAHPQPIAQLHTNPSLGQMVLIIETRGNNYSD